MQSIAAERVRTIRVELTEATAAAPRRMGTRPGTAGGAPRRRARRSNYASFEERCDAVKGGIRGGGPSTIG